MTRLPLDNRNVVGAPGPNYTPESECAHPFCFKTQGTEYDGLERHHIWRRSFLGGGFNWVKLPDGRVVGNVVDLCREHHRQVTENKESIRWTDEHGYVWDRPLSDSSFKLNPQPPLSFSDADEIPSVFSSSDFGSHPAPGENCPTCDRRVPHPKKESSPKTSVVKSWRMPAEEKENREELIAATAEHLGISTKEKFWMDKLILHLCVIALQGTHG